MVQTGSAVQSSNTGPIVHFAIVFVVGYDVGHDKLGLYSKQ
jgi:hypothetical protein